MVSDKLVISLLGPPELKIGNKTLHIRRRMFRYLIFYLACHSEPCSRESLCEMFWPLESESVSRKNLREVISKIRHDLPIENLIITEKEYVSLNREMVEVDFQKFDYAINLIREHLDETISGRIPDNVYIAVQDALKLWRADNFLGGISTTGTEPFQRWVSDTTESLQYWRQMMLEWLADRCIVVGNSREAIGWLSQARKFDLLNTEINTLMLTCLRDLNLWSEALHFCSLIEKDYADSDETEIPSSLHDLVDRIREESRQLTERPHIFLPDDANSPGNFVGRIDLLTEMDNIVNRGGVLLIRGESGSGKSALLKKFTERMEMTPRLYSLNANPGDVSIKYRAITDCFRKGTTAAEIAALEPINAIKLLPIMPEIINYRDDLDLKTFSTVQVDEKLIPEAFLNLFTLIKPKKKNLLVVDNAQWLDSGSLDVISYVMSHYYSDNTLSVILTTRSDIQNEFLDRFMDSEFRGQTIKIMMLPPLKESEIAEIVYHAFHVVCPAEFSRNLERISGGNAGYIELMINSLKEAKFDINNQQLRNFSFLNEPITNAITQNLSMLDKEDFQLLRALSLLGELISPVLIVQVVKYSEPDLIEALERLRNRQLIKVVELPEGNEAFRFTHGIEAEYLKSTINPLERKRVNLQLAKAIIDKEGDGEKQAGRLAFHFQEAGELHEALKYWIRAGKFERHNKNRQEAVRYFIKAQDLILQLGVTVESDIIYELAREWSDLADETNDYAAFLTICEFCLLEGENRKNQKLIGFAKSGYGWIAHFRGYYDVADNFFHQAIGLFEKNDNKQELMDTFLRMGINYFSAQDFIRAGKIFEKLMKMVFQYPSSESLLTFRKCAPLAIYVFCVLGNIEYAQEVISESKLINLGPVGSISSIRFKTAEIIVKYYCGYLDEIKQQADHTLEELVSNQLDWWVYVLQIVNGEAALERGDINSCWKISTAFTEMSSPMVDPEWGNSYNNYLRGEIFSHLGVYDRAEDYFLGNKGVANDEFISLISKLGLIRTKIYRGKYKGCKQVIEEVINRSYDHGLEMIAQGALVEKANLDLAQFKGEIFAKGFIREYEKLANSEYIHIRIMHLEQLGRLHLLIGDKAKAEEYLLQALKDAKEHRYLWLQISILQKLREFGDEYRIEIRDLKRVLEYEELVCEIAELQPAFKSFNGSL